MNTRGELLLYLRSLLADVAVRPDNPDRRAAEHERIQKMIDWVRTKTVDDTDPAGETPPGELALSAAKARIRKLEAAAPVMLSVLALLADEATEAGVRECAVHYCENDPDHLDVWLDAEAARKDRELG